MSRIGIGLVLVLSGLFIIKVQAQYYNFTNYSIEQGLPQSKVYAIFHDSHGYLWLGTEGGAARFDGFTFETFDRNSGLPSNAVRTIVETTDGLLWAGTENGLACYNGKIWKTINGISGTSILKLSVDKNNFIWAATNDGGINIIKPFNDSILIENINALQGLSGDFILDILHGADNFTYIAAIGGLTRMNTDSFNNIEDFGENIHLPGKLISCLDHDATGNLYIGTLDEGAFIWKQTDQQLIGLYKSTGINDPKIWDIFCDTDGSVWYATNESGIYWENKGYFTHIGTENGLPYNLVLNIYRDKNHNLWMGTISQGFALFQGMHLVHYSQKDGIAGSQVFAVKADKNNNLWIGGNQKGISVATQEHDKLHIQHLTVANKFQSNEVSSIAFNSKGMVVAGTRGDGLAFFDGQRFDFLNIADGLIHNNINCIYAAPNGSLFAGTDLGFNEITETKILSITEDDGLINPEVQTIVSDQQGNIWMGTFGGLAKFQAKTNQYRDFNEEEGLFDLRIHTLAVDVKNHLWIGTNNGIYKYLEEKDTIVPFSETVMNSKTINSLLFWNDSVLIVGTLNGFNRIVFNKNVDQIISNTSYDKLSGFKPMETNINAICNDIKNHIWFGTIEGLTCYRPELEDTSSYQPIVALSKIRLSFEPIDWVKKGYETEKWSSIPINLDLPYTENHITFDFRGIYLKQPERVMYRYRLEPFEKQWSPISKQHSVTYPGLSDNKYTFSLIASHDGIQWSEPLNYSFVISPPFWKTGWFYIVVFLIAAIVLMAYIQWREKKLVKEKEHLEQIVKERTAEVVAQKEEIEKQKEEITDSITYAKRIQQAVLPGNLILNQFTQESFILYKPRDIVSGDFYWIDANEDYLVVAAADCTGHGVPGAFMSMLGVSFMNKIIKEQKVIAPDEILSLMRQNVISSLKQGDHEGSSKDGMDMAICIINLKSKMLHYSGAYNPAIIISDGEATELKADRMPVGYHIVMNNYTPISLQLKQGDCIYLFSDGYQDQMGGPDGRKFMRKNLREFLVSIHQKPFCEQRELLDSNIENWRNHPQKRIDQMDDILVIGLKV